MKLFLRLIMLVMLAAWGTSSWAKVVKIDADTRALRDQSGSQTIKDEASGIELSVDKGVINIDKSGLTLSERSFVISKDSPIFTIKSTKGHIFRIYFDFDNDMGTKSQGSEHWSDSGLSSGKLNRTKTPGASSERAAYWENTTPQGVESVSLKGDGKGDVYLQWIYVWYVDPTEDDMDITINGDEYFTDDNNVSVSSESSNLYWTIDGTTPSASNTQSSSAVIKTSCEVQAITTKVEDVSSKVDYDNTQNVTLSYKVTKHFYKYWNVPISPAGLATFAHDHNMIVPEGVKAITYKIKSYNSDGSASVLTPSHTYNSGEVLPANTAVVVQATPGSTVRFINTDYNNGEGAVADGDNILLGNYTNNTQAAANDPDNYYYYLMQRSATSDTYGFFWGSSDGSAISLAPHKAYYTYPKKSDQRSKGFVLQLPDETTGINGIETDYNAAENNAPIYNTSGQRVGRDYKGIVIKNGRKYIAR